MPQKKLRKYIVFSKSSIMNSLAYIGMTYTWMIGSLISLVLLIVLWTAIYRYSDQEVISGFHLAEMETYVVFSFLAGYLCFSSDSFYSISQDVRDGRIAMNLIKPIHYHTKLIFESIGAFLSNVMIIFLPLGIIGLGITTLIFHYPFPKWYFLFMFLIACFFSSLLVDAFNFLFGQVAFMSTSIFGLGQIKETVLKFLSGGMIPLALFPLWGQKILQFTPFPSMITFPVKLLMGEYTSLEIAENFGISVLWMVVLYAFGEVCYHFSIKHLANNGG